ncbi:MAG TPA: enoyl-CoA hydratase-related protein [Solirubrobacterales bacterium]|nr:enoyl-CoA hydratase-related protein [Solirubrobacterales bacterium]
MESPLRVDKRGPVWVLVLDRPDRLNAVNAELSRAVNECLTEFEADQEALVGIITGAGERAFSTGADLAEVAAGGLAEIIDIEPGGFAGVRHPRAKPLIAAVNGIALGGGFEIALACELIVAAEGVEFGLPEVSRGFLAGAGGLQRLPRIIGRQRAMEVILAGARLDATAAHGLGLVNHVVPPAQLLDRALELAEQIVGGAPLAVRESSAAARAAFETTEDNSWARVEEGWRVVLASDDYREGVAAFAERREPRWSGN